MYYAQAPYPGQPTTPAVYVPAVPASYSSSPKYVARPGVPPAPGSHLHVTQVGKKPGFFGSISKVFDTSLSDVGHVIDKGLSHVPLIDSEEKQAQRFRKHFGMPVHERLIFELPCKAATHDTVLVGHLYLSNNFLCFYCDPLFFQVVIPLNQVVAIHHAVQASRSVTPEIPIFLPHTQATAAERSVGASHALEVYTCNSQVHIFFSLPLGTFDKTLATLEYTWKTACSTPPSPATSSGPPTWAPSAPPPAYPAYPQYAPPANPYAAASAPPLPPKPY